MTFLQTISPQNPSSAPHLNLFGELVHLRSIAYTFAGLLLMLLLVTNQAYCQYGTSDRVKSVSDTYFIESEDKITGNIKRRIQIEEEVINDSQSIVSILSDGQQVFSSRRYNHALEISGGWNYVYSSDNVKENGLQIERPCKLMFSADGEGFTISLTPIKIRPKGGALLGVMQALDQAQRGVKEDNMEFELALDNGRKATATQINYIRKKNYNNNRTNNTSTNDAAVEREITEDRQRRQQQEVEESQSREQQEATAREEQRSEQQRLEEQRRERRRVEVQREQQRLEDRRNEQRRVEEQAREEQRIKEARKVDEMRASRRRGTLSTIGWIVAGLGLAVFLGLR